MSGLISKLSVINSALKRLTFKLWTNSAVNMRTKFSTTQASVSKSFASKCRPCSEKPQHSCDTSIVEKCGHIDIPHGNSKPYRILSFCMFPLIMALAYHVLTSPHEELHPQYVPYEYMYRRSKRFPWADGRHSYFHGPYNLIPGEETHHPDMVSNAEDGDLKRRKALRDQHAKEELERRRQRRERNGQ